MPQVRLTTLPVLRRYSLALRQEWGDAETLLQTLEDSLVEVRRALGEKDAASNLYGSSQTTRARAAEMGGSARPRRDGDERLREEP